MTPPGSDRGAPADRVAAQVAPTHAAPAAFANEPLLELRRAEVRAAALAALTGLDARLPLDVRIEPRGAPAARARFASVDPCRPGRVVAHADAATAEDVDAAVARASRAGRAWGAGDAAERSGILLGAAALLRARRLELTALAVRECAKPWPEADADVCEAIDFLAYYAQGAVALAAGPRLAQPPGERNRQRHAPLGVVAVIAPWNFPFAIVAGMTAAALAVGNAVVLKPAEQAPACAAAVVAALHEAGVPRAALQLLPGGDAPGRVLVAHPHVRAIAFTGSCAAGLEIVAQAARTRPGQRHVKRVVAEMGGKNCVIVDADADLDDAVPAIVASAFGFAGQKCSAASRVLVHEAVAGELRERLAGAVRTLVVGPADELATDVPAVIDAEARERIARCAELGRATGTVLARPPRRAAPTGFYVAPLLLADLPADSPLLREEVFGPVLTVETVPDVDAACDRVDALGFALTGGLFSRSPATVAHVARRSPVGNLYVNREITGAKVGRQPFGGNRLSGSGAKAGGPDYLLHFVEARVVTENTIRHGLVV